MSVLLLVVVVTASGGAGADLARSSYGRVTLTSGFAMARSFVFEPASVAWCGSGETPDNRLPQSDALSPSTVRVFYAFPTDAPDRFATLADAIVSDVSAIDGWWRAQDPTRTPRWDVYAFPDCGDDGLASLDLGVIPLAHDRAYYARGSGFDRVLSEVAPYLGATEKALVYLDAFVIDERVCGVSEQAPRNGGRYGLSLVSLQSGCSLDLGAGAATARVAAHELTHNLGAVPSDAPNRCADASLGGHVCDSPRDLMFPYAASELTLGTGVLDTGRDDYYGHASSWWDVQNSAWLVHLPFRTLRLAVAGPGAVTSKPPVTACPGGCASTLESDFAVTLVAQAEPGAEFYGWKGACAGESACRLTMTGDLAVQATFGPPRPTLSVRVKGKGSVTSAPRGIASPNRSSAKFPTGTRVRLEARPRAGWRLARWSSTLGSKPTCALVLTTDRTVTATFVRARKVVEG